MSKHVEGGKGSDSERQGKGGRAGRSPGRGFGENAGTTSGGLARSRPPRGYGATGGPAGRKPKEGHYPLWRDGYYPFDDEDEDGAY